MSQSDTGACEDCGAGTEMTAAWKGGGYQHGAQEMIQGVQRADWLLGHRGYLCTRHWWERIAARREAA